jgi:MRG-binding protein
MYSPSLNKTLFHVNCANQEPQGFTPPNGEPRLAPESPPSPSENLNAHAFFRAEFALPLDPDIEADIAARRVADAPSPASSSPPSSTPPPPVSPARSSKRKRNGKKVEEESDMSDLTQSGEDDGEDAADEESVAAAPQESEQESEDEDEDSVREDSPGACSRNYYPLLDRRNELSLCALTHLLPSFTATSKRRGRGWNLKRGARTRGNPARGTTKKRKRAT